MTGTVSRGKRSRKALANLHARFKAALALSRTTAREWCERERITEQHLYAVLKGKRESASLLTKVDAFVEKHSQPASAVA